MYEQGTNYGSSILNHQIKPDISILNGKDAELRPVITNGRIEDVIVTNQGTQYNSLPDIEIITTGSGSGAIVRPVISNGSIIDTSSNKLRHRIQ